MQDATGTCRSGYVFDPGFGQLMTRQELVSNAALYTSDRFSLNFLWYAPQTTVTLSPTQNSGMQWSECDVNGSEYPDSGNGPTPCPSPSDVVPPPASHTPIDDWDFNDATVTLDTWTWMQSSIFLVCGNPIYPVTPEVPVPTVTGSKFDDLNQNGVWDTGEPGIPNWPMTLTRVTSDFNDQPIGVVVATTTTDSNGNFDFPLNGDGPGEYAVTEGSEPDWYNDTGGTTEYVTVDPGIGDATLSVPPFGNWHQITIAGSKFDDLNKNGVWDTGEPGIPNWPMTLTRVTSDFDDQPTGVVVATTSTDSNGNFDFVLNGDGGPGVYAVTEGSEPDWYNDTGGTTEYVTLDPGIGPSTLSVPPFGNWNGETGSQVHAVIQVETSPSYAGDLVQVSSSQLSDSCQGTVLFETLQGGSTTSPRVAINVITVALDDEGNATVVVDASGCAPGSDLVEADLTGAPYLTATTILDVKAPQVTSTGVVASPNPEVETGDGPSGSEVYTVFYVETDPVYAGQPVEISSPGLQNRCGMGWRWEPTGGPAITQASPATPVEATLDGDGNAVFVFKGESCAPGASTVIADVLAGSHPTYSTTFTIDPPAVTLAGPMAATDKHHHHHHHGSDGDPPTITVTASPNPLVETSGMPVLDTLNVTKSDNYGGSSDPATVGQITDYNGTLTYTINVNNSGPGALDGIAVFDPLSSDSDYTSDTYTATSTGGATGFSSLGSGDINDTVDLPAGSSITYKVSYEFEPCGPAGSLSNTVILNTPAGVTLSPASNTTAIDDDIGPPC